MKFFSKLVGSLFTPIPENPQSLIDGFLNGYGERFHCTNEQYIRFCRAMEPGKIGNIIFVDSERMYMKISSFRNPRIKYKVSLDNCNCKDFDRRHLPCKHIYRLALELGIVSPEWDLSGITPEIQAALSSLSESQQKTFFRLIDKQGKKYDAFETTKRSAPAALLKAGFIEEEPQEKIIDKHYKKQELLSFLSVSEDCPLPSSTVKTDIVNYIVANEPKLAKTLYEKYYCIRFSEMLIDNYDYIYRYLSELYEKR